MALDRRQVMAGAIGIAAGALAGSAGGAEGSAKHLVLLGDSIFDNKVYVDPAPSVSEQLQKSLPAGWKGTLRAVDGDTVDDVAGQLETIPADATHLFLSIGGNDALGNAGVLTQPVKTVAEGALKLGDLRDKFRRRYEQMIVKVLARKLPTTLCTIYDPNFAIPMQQQAAIVGLCVYNDVIVRTAVRRGLPVIDLRTLFAGPEDYANSIEPGPAGGQKIVDQIIAVARDHDFSKPRSVLYG